MSKRMVIPLFALALAGCGVGPGDGDTVELTAVHATADGPKSEVLTVPRSYVNEQLARRAAVARGETASHEQALISNDAWPCSDTDMWMADASWAHFTCAGFNTKLAGSCGDLTTWPRYWYWYNGQQHWVYWGHAVRFFWPGTWSGCWAGSNTCGGSGGWENFTANSSGSTCDPSNNCGWFTADTFVRAADGISTNCIM